MSCGVFPQLTQCVRESCEDFYLNAVTVSVALMLISERMGSIINYCVEVEKKSGAIQEEEKKTRPRNIIKRRFRKRRERTNINDASRASPLSSLESPLYNCYH